VFNMNVTESQANVGGHTAYLPPVMLQKMLYLVLRLNVRGELSFYKPKLPADLVCMVRNLDSLSQFQQFQEKIQQVHIKMLAV